MNHLLLPVALTCACLMAVLLLLWSDWRGSMPGRVAGKLAASTCFVGLALVLDASASTYGQWLLAALLLGWLGDALLLSKAANAFLAGLVAFLLAHLCFAVAFASGPMSWAAIWGAGAVALLVGAFIVRWLWPHLPGQFKMPVLVYIVVILAMCVTAAGHAGATQRGWVMLGALLFAVSDVAVARERFVRSTFFNRLWGLPIYFVAQMILAWTVIHPATVAPNPLV